MCKAEIAEAAEGPDVAVETDCGLAVDIPAVGSDFPGGHSPRLVFFFDAQVSPEVDVLALFEADGAAMVAAEETDEFDCKEEEDLVR